MTFKRYEWRILITVLLLLITLGVASFLAVKGLYVYLIIIGPVVIYQVIEFYRFQRKAHEELGQFVEAIHYRDFSRIQRDQYHF